MATASGLRAVVVVVGAGGGWCCVLALGARPRLAGGGVLGLRSRVVVV